MSVRCRSCNYLITDPWANGCPLCGAPYSGGGGGRGGFRGGGGGSPRTPLYLGLGAIFALFVGCSLMNRFMAQQVPVDDRPPVRQADSTGRIKLGMPVTAAARELDAEAGRRRSAPDAIAARYPEIDTKTGHLSWAKDGRALVIHFAGGRVTRIAETETSAREPEVVAVHYYEDDPPEDEP